MITPANVGVEAIDGAKHTITHRRGLWPGPGRDPLDDPRQRRAESGTCTVLRSTHGRPTIVKVAFCNQNSASAPVG